MGNAKQILPANAVLMISTIIPSWSAISQRAHKYMHGISKISNQPPLPTTTTTTATPTIDNAATAGDPISANW